MNSLDNAMESQCELCVLLLKNFMAAMKEGFKPENKKSLESTYTVETSIWTNEQSVRVNFWFSDVSGI